MEEGREGERARQSKNLGRDGKFAVCFRTNIEREGGREIMPLPFKSNL